MAPGKCGWTLVRRGNPVIVYAEIWAGAFEGVIPTTMNHADAVRLAEWMDRGPGSAEPLSPRHMPSGARELALSGHTSVACIVGWNDDGSPRWERVRLKVAGDQA